MSIENQSNIPSSGVRPACAACKHQRRRCSPNCPLAAYFPSEKKQEFHNVHRLFGVNNVVSLLKKVAQHDHDNTMKSVIYEANIRAMNPVGGCCALINDLHKQIDLCNAELHIVKKNLAFHRGNYNYNAYGVGFSGNIDRKPSFRNQESCTDIE